MGMTILLSEPEIHAKTKQSEQVYHHSGETNHLIFTSQVVFIIRFLADTVRCQFSDNGLQFSLVEHIHNAQLYQCQRTKTVSLFSELLLQFYLDIEIVDWFTEMTAAWSLDGTFEPTSHHP
jgi:hypothetical protein